MSKKEILTEQNVEKAFHLLDQDNNGSFIGTKFLIFVSKGKTDVFPDNVLQKFYEEIGIIKEEKGFTLEGFKKMFV